ncbi:hypothetical protein [Paenibacillus azoreducens]|uniref:Uncharacterized protein n=1 Tax=Paenibacillus azoreducens TaxID=116718 RepID=A0A919YC21_9BACL|nr:hypothetical protein [Paenibacillus azoreducens]GIO47956.1 hypothetical protein J34TS1_27210 [Paenibacillus azoreducens]
MIQELKIAARYGQKVILRIHDGDVLTGKAELSADPSRIKIRTSEGPVWVPYEDIEHVERLVRIH